jgi:hypothetical protein
VLACLLLPAQAETPAASVAEVDLARYAGKWYEIASFPMFFQRNCVGDTTAEYALTPEGDVSVTNRCRTADGFDEAKGTAAIVDGSRNAGSRCPSSGLSAPITGFSASMPTIAGPWSAIRTGSIYGYFRGLPGCPGSCWMRR